jgi:hypothetical protein
MKQVVLISSMIISNFQTFDNLEAELKSGLRLTIASS